MTSEIAVLALLADTAVQARLSLLGADRQAIAEALGQIIDSQPDRLEGSDMQPSAGFMALLDACIAQHGRQIEPLAAIHVALSQQDSAVRQAFTACGLTIERLQAPLAVEAPMDILKLGDIQASAALPPAQETILRRIVDAIGTTDPLRLATDHGAATICLLDIQERDERQAALSIARLMADRAALHVPASSLESHSVAIRKQLGEAAQSGHRLLLWISGVITTFTETTQNGHVMPNAEAFLRLMEQCQALPSTVCLLHAFDSQHYEAARLRRAVPNAFQVSWPLPKIEDRQRHIQALCERLPALAGIEVERPGWIAELARMAEGLSTGDLSELFARAERTAVMDGALAPDFAILMSGVEELHRHSRTRSRSTGDPAHVRTLARMRVGSNVRGLESLAGMENVKKELNRYRALVVDRDRFIRAGCRVPRGLLLKGSPGVGKTAVARAFADSLGRPFFSVAGAEFTELYVGVGAARVRDLFKSARLAQPCVVFIDELDSIGARRDGAVNSESSSTLNQLLVEMDGFDASDGVFVMAATNRVDILDAALTRAGRFDAIIEVPVPDDQTREAILRLRLAERHTLNAAEIAAMVESTDSFVGAELESMVNRARVENVLDGGDGVVTREQLEASLAHVMSARQSNPGDSHDDRFFY